MTHNKKLQIRNSTAELIMNRAENIDIDNNNRNEQDS